MSFFKDFKDDLSQAVNELLPGEELPDGEEAEETSEMMVNTLEGELDIESELSKLDGLLEPVEEKENAAGQAPFELEEPVLEQLPDEEPPTKRVPPKPQPQKAPAPKPQREAKRENGMEQAISRMSSVLDIDKGSPLDMHLSYEAEPKGTEVKPQAAKQPASNNVTHNHKNTKTSSIKEDVPMSEEMTKEPTVDLEEEIASVASEITDEVSIITDGTHIKGNLSTTGSFSISGSIEGNVQCNGKLEVTGTIKGNSSSSEVFSDAAKIEGEIVSTGTVKIGLGSVVVGNISATSAVIAGAVKGDIDVQGPVVVDTSAVIVGNIKSRSVQINNGAVIEGFCSQCYADIDVDSLFGDKKGK